MAAAERPSRRRAQTSPDLAFIPTLPNTSATRAHWSHRGRLGQLLFAMRPRSSAPRRVDGGRPASALVRQLLDLARPHGLDLEALFVRPEPAAAASSRRSWRFCQALRRPGPRPDGWLVLDWNDLPSASTAGGADILRLALAASWRAAEGPGGNRALNPPAWGMVLGYVPVAISMNSKCWRPAASPSWRGSRLAGSYDG